MVQTFGVQLTVSSALKAPASAAERKLQHGINKTELFFCWEKIRKPPAQPSPGVRRLFAQPKKRKEKKGDAKAWIIIRIQQQLRAYVQMEASQANKETLSVWSSGNRDRWTCCRVICAAAVKQQQEQEHNTGAGAVAHTQKIRPRARAGASKNSKLGLCRKLIKFSITFVL